MRLHSLKNPFQLGFREKTVFRFYNFVFIKSINTTLKSEKVSRAKLFFKNIDFTTLVVVAVNLRSEKYGILI